jgi:KaiC domain protein
VATVSEGEGDADGEEDWFEAALGEDPPEDVADWDDAADDVDWDDFEESPPADFGDDRDDPDEAGDADASGDFDAADDDGTAPDSAPEPPDEGDDADDADADEDLFEEGFAAAMDEAPPVDDTAGPAPGDPDGFDPEAGGGAGAEFDVGDGQFDAGDGQFGMGGGGGAEFDAGAGGDFGMGGGTGPDFDDEELDSDIPRIDLGIEGLDEMIHGGVPPRSLMVAIGSAGTGKTTFGLQFLHEALANGERAIFITLEESRQRVINSATEKGMAFDEHAAAGDLAVVDIDPIEMANSLTSIRSELPRLVEEFGATRLVLDSVSLLEMMYDDRAKRRNEIYDFTRSLKRAGVTTMLTSEASEDSAFASRHGIVEYLTDAVFILQYVRPSDFRETRLAIEIQKIRDASHSRETKPYEITGDGISVFQGANIF